MPITAAELEPRNMVICLWVFLWLSTPNTLNHTGVNIYEEIPCEDLVPGRQEPFTCSPSLYTSHYITPCRFSIICLSFQPNTGSTTVALPTNVSYTYRVKCAAVKFDWDENKTTLVTSLWKKKLDFQPAPLLDLAFVLVSCIRALLDFQLSVDLFNLNRL